MQKWRTHRHGRHVQIGRISVYVVRCGAKLLFQAEKSVKLWDTDYIVGTPWKVLVSAALARQDGAV